MKTKHKELIILITIGFVSMFIIGLFLKNILSAIKFALIYSFLFYLPVLPWTINIKKLTTFGKFIITIILGISIIPLLYALIGYFTPLNTTLFILPPIVLGLMGFILNKTIFNKIYKEKQEPEKDGTIHNNPGI